MVRQHPSCRLVLLPRDRVSPLVHASEHKALQSAWAPERRVLEDRELPPLLSEQLVPLRPRSFLPVVNLAGVPTTAGVFRALKDSSEEVGGGGGRRGGSVGGRGRARRGARNESVEERVEDVEEVVGVGAGIVKHLEGEGSNPPVGNLVPLVGREVAVEGQQRGEGVGGELCSARRKESATRRKA